MTLMRECSTTEEWQEIEVPSASTKGKTYIVTLPPWDRNKEEVSCECPSFVHRGYCHHQREALALACSWRDEDLSIETCPECGAETTVVEVND